MQAGAENEMSVEQGPSLFEEVKNFGHEVEGNY